MTWSERSELSCVGWCVHCKCTYSDDAQNLLCPIHVIRAFILSFRAVIDSYELLCCLSKLLYVHTSFYAISLHLDGIRIDLLHSFIRKPFIHGLLPALCGWNSLAPLIAADQSHGRYSHITVRSRSIWAEESIFCTVFSGDLQQWPGSRFSIQ